MRTIHLGFIALILGLMVVSAPVPVFADKSSPFVKFLVDKACGGESYGFRNGCNAYLHKRITQKKDAAPSLSECKDWCSRTFSENPANKSLCDQGCGYLNSQE